MGSVYVEPMNQDFWQLARDSSGAYVDRWGPLDCGTHSAARAIVRGLEGARPAGNSHWPPTGEFVRSVTRNKDGSLDRVGGTNIGQAAKVAHDFFGVELLTYYNLAWEAFLDMADDTRGWILPVSYHPFVDTKYDAGRGFGRNILSANHAIYGNSIDRAKGIADRLVDPLAGPLSRTGIFYGPGAYPLALLKESAGKLNVSSDPNHYVPLGAGRVYVAFTHPTGAPPAVASGTKPTGRVVARRGTYTTYRVVNGRAVVAGSFNTGGFSADCVSFLATQRDGTGKTTLLRLLPPSSRRGVLLYRYTKGLTYTAY